MKTGQDRRKVILGRKNSNDKRREAESNNILEQNEIVHFGLAWYGTLDYHRGSLLGPDSVVLSVRL